MTPNLDWSYVPERRSSTRCTMTSSGSELRICRASDHVKELCWSARGTRRYDVTQGMRTGEYRTLVGDRVRKQQTVFIPCMDDKELIKCQSSEMGTRRHR